MSAAVHNWRRNRGTATEEERNKLQVTPWSETKRQQKPFMRSVKPHHSWKLDDERRKRPGGSSVPASPTTTNSNSPDNYTPEKLHAGMDTNA